MKGRRALAAACLLLSAPVLAQQAPGAGAILRQLAPGTPPALPVPKAAAAPARKRPPPPAGPAVHVRSFRFEGNHLLSTAQLARVVASYVGRDLTPKDLRDLTDAVARRYRKAGWLARAIVPRQRINDGVLSVQVIEGRFGKVRFSDDTDVDDLRVKPQRIIDRAQDRLTPGQPVYVPDLERGVLLAGDLAGITVAGDEAGGEQSGQTDLVLTVDNERPVTGDFTVDNYGQASIGSEQAIGRLDFNSLFGAGEQLEALGLLTPQMQYARLAAAVPLNDDGLRLDVNTSGLDYTVAAPGYQALKARGSSDTLGGDLDYQLIRATDHNLDAGVGVERKNFYNLDAAVMVSDYHIYDARVYLSGNVYDAFAGGAVSTADVSFGRGWQDMAGSPNEIEDRFGPDTQGEFSVLRYRLDRTQHLNETLSLYAAYSGQLSYQNLDPAEQFYLGGPYAVRAFAVASNGASSGQVLNTELRWAPSRAAVCSCSFKLLYDAGHARVYANDEFPGAPQPNSYFLQDAGAGVSGIAPGGVQFALTAVRRVGGDAGAEFPGSGLTGARQNTRVWASLTEQF